MKKYFYIATNCCAVQRSETYRIENFFIKNGWLETTECALSDINIITTCGVTNDIEESSFCMIDRVAKQAKASSKLIVSGCLPNICIDNLRMRYPQAIFIPLDQLEGFDSLISATYKIRDVTYNNNARHHHSKGDPRLEEDLYADELIVAESLSQKFADDRILQAYNYATPGRYLWKDNSIFEVKISSGCNNNCSYCASRFGVGRYRSKALEKIKKEVEDGLSQGYQMFMLMGDELGDYGCDIGLSLVDVLKLCVEIEPNIQIGIRYIHPDKLVELFNYLKVYLKNIFFCCISIQSASPRVLEKMNRIYNMNDVEAIIKNLNLNYSHIFLHTQIIIGFPNESEDDFVKTINFLQRCKFDFIRYNVFSPRKITQAYSYKIVYTPVELERRIETMKHFCEGNRIERLYRRYCSIISEKQV